MPANVTSKDHPSSPAQSSQIHQKILAPGSDPAIRQVSHTGSTGCALRRKHFQPRPLQMIFGVLIVQIDLPGLMATPAFAAQVRRTGQQHSH